MATNDLRKKLELLQLEAVQAEQQQRIVEERQKIEQTLDFKMDGYALQNKQWASQTRDRSLTFKKEGQKLKERKNDLRWREEQISKEESKIKHELKRASTQNIGQADKNDVSHSDTMLDQLLSQQELT